MPTEAPLAGIQHATKIYGDDPVKRQGVCQGKCDMVDAEWHFRATMQAISGGICLKIPQHRCRFLPQEPPGTRKPETDRNHQ